MFGHCHATYVQYGSYTLEQCLHFQCIHLSLHGLGLMGERAHSQMSCISCCFLSQFAAARTALEMKCRMNHLIGVWLFCIRYFCLKYNSLCLPCNLFVVTVMGQYGNYYSGFSQIGAHDIASYDWPSRFSGLSFTTKYLGRQLIMRFAQGFIETL